MDALRLGSLALPNRVLAAAGALGYGVEAARFAPVGGLGALVTSGIAWRRRRGSAAGVVEAPAGAIYTPGAGRAGVADVLRRSARAWASLGCPIIANLVADEAGEFAAAAAALQGVQGVAAVELNFACLDAATGEAFGHQPAAVSAITRRVRLACALPVLAKLPADTPALEDCLRACASAGAAAATLAAGLPAGEGYLVGPASIPVILPLVRRAAAGAGLPVIACGGIATGAQARAYLRAGAAAVQVGSAHLANPRAAVDVLEALEG